MILIQILTVMFFALLSILYARLGYKSNDGLLDSSYTNLSIIWLTLTICAFLLFFITQSLSIICTIIALGLLVLTFLFVRQDEDLYAILPGIVSFILLMLANFVF